MTALEYTTKHVINILQTNRTQIEPIVLNPKQPCGTWSDWDMFIDVVNNNVDDLVEWVISEIFYWPHNYYVAEFDTNPVFEDKHRREYIYNLNDVFVKLTYVDATGQGWFYWNGESTTVTYTFVRQETIMVPQNVWVEYDNI